jgi:hypothetical protein
MTKWLAKYKNDAGQEVWSTEVEKDSNGQSFWLDERGFPRPFEREFDHPTLGHLTLSGTPVAIPEEPPTPPDHEHNKAVGGFLNALNTSFPSDELRRQFENEHKEIVRAINTKFKGVSLEQMAAWRALIREAIPAPPKYGPYELRKLFYHSRADYGQLRIDGPEPKQYGTEANNFEDTEWWVYCGICEKPGQQARYATAEVLLEIEAGIRGKYSCQRPCRN